MEVFVSSEIITLTRAELYEKVWNIPMLKLAKEFGLSDVGLAKLCRRHEIPVPGRGYWARIQFGQTPGRITLPALKLTRLDTIRIVPSDPKKMQPLVSEAGEVFPQIQVAADGPITHRIARRIEKSMAKSRADDRGVLLTKQGRIVPIKLTAGALHRANRILDALFTALEGAKAIVDWPSPYNTPLKIVSDVERLQFILTETIERKEHKPTSEELARQESKTWWQPHRWDYTPTGRLKFTLESCEYPGISQSWADGRQRRLDTCLGEILVACQTMAAAIKRERDDRARHQRDLERQRLRELEAREREEEDLRKSEVVKKAAESLELSQDIRRLVVCLGSTNKIHELRYSCFGHFKQMLEWCTEYANSLDPTNRLADIVEEFASPQGGAGEKQRCFTI
jgi:hypothetical protein